MQPAADDFETALRGMGITFNKPSVPFYSNLTGDVQTDFDDMPSKLAKHIVSPVKFTSELNALAELSSSSAFSVLPSTLSFPDRKAGTAPSSPSAIFRKFSALAISFA